MNRFICFRITLIIVFIAVFFNRVSAVEFDSGMMFGITVQKQFTKRFGAQVQQNLWINQNFTRYERYMPIVGLHYSIWKNYLKANVYYYYLNQLSETGYRIHRQRYQLGLSDIHLLTCRYLFCLVLSLLIPEMLLGILIINGVIGHNSVI